MMKQKKNKGALVVSLLLAAAMLALTIGTAVSIGVTYFKGTKGENSVEAARPVPDDFAEDDKPSVEVMEEPAQEVSAYPEHVEFEKITGDDYSMYAEITGHFADGRLWQYYTPAYPVTELEPVDEICAYEDTFIFCAGGRVIALDTMTGMEKWVNEDFGGYSPVYVVDEQRNLWLCGYYGPDLHMIDADGKTVAHVDQLDVDYWWPIRIQKADAQTVSVVFSMGPEGDGEYTLSYDLANGGVIVPEMAAPVQEDLRWMEAYRAYLERENTNGQNDYALVYIDEDEIPELFARGYEKSAVICYDAQKDAVAEHSFDGYELCYYAGTGVISMNRYEEMQSEETFYTLKNGVQQRIGTAKMHHYDDEREPECWWEGESIPVNDFYKKLNTFRPTDVRSSYAATYPKQMLLAQLDNWQDPDKNIYWGWKEEYLESVRRNMNGTSQYALVDVDGNGMPELFVRYEEGNGQKYTQMQSFNPKTQQSMHIGFSGDQTAYIPGTGIVTDTYIYGEYCSDSVYQISEKTMREIAYGDRHLQADGGQTCYLNGTKISQEAYEKEMSMLYDERAVKIADCFVSAEEILAQLK